MFLFAFHQRVVGYVHHRSTAAVCKTLNFISHELWPQQTRAESLDYKI